MADASVTGGELVLPFARHCDPRAAETSTVPARLAGDALRAVRTLAPPGQVTPFVAALTSFVVLLHRYTGQCDLVVLTTVAGQADPLPLHLNVPYDPTWREVLQEVESAALAAYPQLDTASGSGVAEGTFTLAMPGIEHAPHDLVIEWSERDGDLDGVIRYRTARYERHDMERMAVHLSTLVEQFGQAPDEHLSNLSLLDGPEWRRVVLEWNDTSGPYPHTSSVPDLFEEWVDRAPDAPALHYGEVALSYGQLDARANRLAHYLRRLGVDAEARVGLCVRSAADWVVGALATLKAGGAYVPLDPSYPPERLAYMCRDAGLRAVLLTGDTADRLPADCGYRVPIDAVAEEIAREPSTRPPHRLHPDGLAYVMYTSGSTGQPKGVGVSHRNIVRLVRGTNYIDVRPTDTVAQAANISFDAATFEAWGALLNGARLVGLGLEDILVPERLRAALRTHRVDVLFLATALTRQTAMDAPETFATLRHLTFGGEQADQRATLRLVAHCPGVEILNAYGPTEGTTYTTTYQCNEASDADAVIPIGYPIGNTRAYVLDGYLQPVPPGIVGELYAGGDGVARGYSGRPGLTADRFVPDPFASEPGGRLYRTGDLVRQRPDGAIEFAGRRDQQVKVRGFRVEPGEIEESLRGFERLREVIVRVDRDADGDARLVAYVVLGGGSSDVDELRDYARGRLPEYMVPTTFVTLPRLPLNPNGKIDTQALPSPPWRTTGKPAPVAPRTPTERALAAIWGEVLGVAEVGLLDNFFDLGGRSLKATRVRSRLSAVLGVDLPLRLVFDHPTIASLAAAADRVAGSATTEAIATAPDRNGSADRDGHSLTRAQTRMWLVSQLRTDSPVYNVAYRIGITGDLDVAALEQALHAVVARHEALRTVFVSVDGESRQIVLPPDPDVPALDVRDLAGYAGTETMAERLDRLAREEARRPFDLATGPLIRTTLVRSGAADWVLLLTLHHVVCDGWSMPILYDDLAQAYAAHRDGTPLSLPALPRYPEVAHRQDQSLGPAARERLFTFWKEKLSGAPATLDLLPDRPRPALLGDEGEQVSFTWSAELAGQVEQAAQRLGATPFVVFLAACHALLYRYTHQPDILIGVPTAGRTTLDAERVVGLFVNTLVLRGRLSDDMSFAQLLDQARDAALAALGNQDMPFDMLVERLGADRDPSGQPLFQVMLAVEDSETDRLQLPGLTVRSEENHTGTAKFDLTFVLRPDTDHIAGRLEYRTELFDRATIVRLAGHLGTLLRSALADPTRPLRDLPMLSGAEQRALADWSTTRPPSPDTRPLHALIEDVTDAAPHAPAVAHEHRTLTYGELDERANRIAHLLHAHGVGPETPVGLCLPNCLDQVAAFLGVLKAGGVYVPLDARLPGERLRSLLDDAGLAVVLASSTTLARLPWTSIPVVELDRGDPAGSFPATRPGVTVPPDGAAYLIYTSGSTGQPKGVVATHRGLRNLAEAQRDLLRVRLDDRLLRFHSPGFDVSISEIVTALSAGAELRLVPRDQRQPGPDLARAIRKHQITVADLPPVALGAMDPDDVPGLRSLTVGGEPCPPDVAAAWARGRQFFNAYGPTETTVTATAARDAGGGTTVPIGLPVRGASAYVLDTGMEPVPIGVAGELYIGGAGVARGYRDDPALTAQRFLPDPFCEEGGQRMYRTGDLVRRLPDGALEFLGRSDSQVKVRGHRIELGEVEAGLRACPGVRRGAVVARQDRPGGTRLVAYVVGDGLSVDSLRRALQRHLPEYMVPAAFVFVDDLPLTPNGKLDERSLPAPGSERPTLGTDYVPPGRGLEESVATVWRDVLGLAAIGIHDNFFDLGGNSLLLARARARLADVLQAEIPAVELYRHPTVALLARFLASRDQPERSQPDRDQHVQGRRRALGARANRVRDRDPKVGSA